MTKDEIKDWMSTHCSFLKYQINSDLSVSSSAVSVPNSFINNQNVKIGHLPFKFKRIDGSFIAQFAGLKSLINCPDEVEKSFNIKCNQIESLEHGPKKVYESYNISGNPIKTFKFLPDYIGTHMVIDDDVKVDDPYEWRYFLFKEIKAIIFPHETSENVATIIRIVNKYLGKPDQFHIAIDELMNLGEARGFTYD